MNRKLQALKYILLDLLSAGIAWAVFYFYRKQYIENAIFQTDEKFFVGMAIIPIFWVFMYMLTGTYKIIYRKSRLRELGQTLFISLIGVLIIFFTLLLDDEVASYKQYYKTFIVLFSLHFTLTFLPRFILSSITAHKIHNRSIGFNTLLVGSNQIAFDTYIEIENAQRSA